MPIPKPREGESEREFISRCMENDTMNEDYPDREQRAGVCYTQWRRRNRRSTMKSIFVKSDGAYKEMKLTLEDCVKWFRDHSDEEGNVTEDVKMYDDCLIKANTDGIGWVMSDETLDRDMERFDTSGWELKEYRKNPVVLWAHDQKKPAIGKVINPRAKDGQLKGQIQFSSEDVDPFAHMIHMKVKEGIISAGSVGYKPLKIELVEDEKDPCRLIYRKQELREFSICNIPANPNALSQDQKEEEEEAEKITDDLKEIIDMLRADVDNIKQMQIDLNDKMTNDTKNYFEDLFTKERPTARGLDTFFK